MPTVFLFHLVKVPINISLCSEDDTPKEMGVDRLCFIGDVENTVQV